MSIFDAIILGLIQGLTEFIPVSSSGHLVIASHILGLGDAFTFDVLINFGTLLALVVYYRQRIAQILNSTIKGREWVMIAKLLVATIPAVVIGLTFNNVIEDLNRMVWVVIMMLVIVAIPMILVGKQKDNANNKEIESSISWKTSIAIGISQAIALIPGTSRSGITILTGMRFGISAKRAAEFSFLLAIPTIAGASIKTLLSSKGIEFINNNLGAVIIGNLTSFIAGILAVSFLVSLINRRGLADFGYYRIALAAVLIVLLVTGIM